MENLKNICVLCLKMIVMLAVVLCVFIASMTINCRLESSKTLKDYFSLKAKEGKINSCEDHEIIMKIRELNTRIGQFREYNNSNVFFIDWSSDDVWNQLPNLKEN